MNKSLTHSKYFGFFLCTLFTSLGCCLCFSIQQLLGFPAYLASALTGLLFSFTPKLQFYDKKRLIAAAYAGSFSSMASAYFLETAQELGVVCLLTSASFFFFSHLFRGFGGKLGSISFISFLIFAFISKVIPHFVGGTL